MQSFDVLSRHLSVWGSHFLEASAGTGKTFAIEHLVVRLLLESDEPLLIEQILVVTFTRAATRELKKRIRNNLNAALHQLKSGSPDWDYLKAIEESQTVRQSIRRLEDALACFDAAPIFTIHGFCYQALSECAFEAGVGFHLSDPDEADHLGIIDASIDEYLLHQIDRSSLSPGQVTQLWRHVQKKPERLKARLATLVSQDHEIKSQGAFQTSFESWNQSLLQFKGLNRNHLLADWAHLSANYKQMTSSRFPLQQELLSSILENQQSTTHQFDQLLKEKELFLEKMQSSNLKVRAKTLPPNALHYPGLLDKLCSSLLPIVVEARDPLKTLLRLANDCRREVKTRLQDADIFVPDALLEQMEKNLADSRFIEKIQNRYRAAIIDEFQDTDPLQWEIFRKLFVDKVRSLCLVGDPKQSIYAFRNADLYTYLKAAQCLGEASRKHLDTNYRSTPALVEALNRLFASQHIQGWMSLPQLGINLDVHPVKAGQSIDSTDEIGAIHFFATGGEKSRQGSRWPSDRVEQTALFPYIVQEMLRTKNNRSWNRFAILVKDRYQAQRIWDFLQRHQIPALIRKTAPLNESDAFILLQELMEAVCFPSDLSRLKKLLGNPLIGWDAAAIRGGFEQPQLRRAKEKILFLQERLRQASFSLFFQEFLTSTWDRSATVEEFLLSEGKLELYADLLQLGEIIAEKAWSERRVSEQWLSLFDELASPTPEEEGQLKRRLNSDADAVQILTIHMSKGLEFDTVFALGIASSSPLQDNIVIQTEGKNRIVPFEPGDPACAASLKEIEAEKLRQLYVALTRAKTRVYIPLVVDQTSAHSSPIELYFAAASLPSWNYPSVESFLNQIREDASITLSQIELTPSLSLPLQEHRPLDRPPQHLSPFPPQLVLSYSSLARKGESGSFLSIKDPEILTPLNMPLGTQTGLTFHAIMEDLFRQGAHFFPEGKKISALIEKHTAHTELNRWKDPLFETIWDLLHLPLSTFSLSQIPPSQVQEEMEFLFPCEQGLMKGFADLAFEWGNKYYLLDWKTNYLGPSLKDYSSEQLLNAMEQNDYFLQAKIYAEALKRYVKLFDMRPFSESFGGMFYVFVRGKAVHFEKNHAGKIFQY